MRWFPDWEKEEASCQVGPPLPDAGIAREPPAFCLEPIRQPRRRGGIRRADVTHDFGEVAIGVRGEAGTRHASGAHPLIRPQARENFVRFQQFAAIRLLKAVLNLAD